jgi:hypothetical protein
MGRHWEKMAWYHRVIPVGELAAEFGQYLIQLGTPDSINLLYSLYNDISRLQVWQEAIRRSAQEKLEVT